MTRSACVSGFSLVGGGVKGMFTKLEGGVEGIAVYRTASRCCERVVTMTARGLGVLTLWPLWLTQQQCQGNLLIKMSLTAQ